MKSNIKNTIAACFMLLSFGSVQATTILMDDQYLLQNYSYTGAGWTNFSSALDSSSGGNVTVGNFNDLSYMSGFDAIFVNIRCSTCTLSSTEYNNIESYIDNGGRAVILGENTNWTAWDQQILGMLGGSFSGTYYSGLTSAVSSHELVNGVNDVYLPAGGIVASGGEALFDQNFATVWGDNVLTILDVNIMHDNNWANYDNAQFMNNVADWISAEPASVPEPGTLAIFSLGLLGLGIARKKKSA